MTLLRNAAIALALFELLALWAPSSWAVPSYSRRYGMECSGCHTMWGSLNGAGVTFRLSGYRATFGKDLTPISEDVEIAKGVAIPTTLPLSFITGVGIDSRSEKREILGAGASSTSTHGTSLALEDASIFMTAPLGKNLSAFVEFPMYETRAWEFTPAGNFEARFNAPGRQIKFSTESPAFEVAKFFWNNPFGDATRRDSVNFLAGITHLPLGYASGKVRLSVNQYLIYERTALGLLSPHATADVLGADENDILFRLSEPQVLAETMGMLTFGKEVTDTSKRDTLWGEYHVGVTNASNAKAANNATPAVYGRFVMRYYNQSLGLFGLHKSDLYSDTIRTTASLGGNTSGNCAPAGTCGIMSGAQDPNSTSRMGVDFTLSAVPSGVPVWLENQLMWNKESNPTGFGTEFKWRGGFDQLNWQMSKTTILYARYDWLRANGFDDTGQTVNGVTGITRATPKEWDAVVGWQHLYQQNVKLVFEFRHHVYDDSATGPAIVGLAPSSANAAKLTDNGFTARAMFGF
jgi:hypothetical protein